MAGSVNKAILIGRLGKDPDIKTMASGDRVASFSMATDETWRDKSTGERQQKTTWHNVVVFNEGIVKVVEQYVSKGSQVYVEGALQTRKWTDKEGVERYTTEVVIQRFNGQLTMLGGKPAGGQGEAREARGGGDYGGYGAQSGAGGFSGGRVANGGPKESFPLDPDDEIPFAARGSVW